MWPPPEFLRSAAVVILVAVIAFAFTQSGPRFTTRVVEVGPIPSNPAPDDLSAEFRRCRALGPQDAVDSRCAAVCEEGRRRFFGAPARPLPPTKSASAATPATSNAAISTPGVAR
jgi:conjugative transfer region protein TrbK